MVGFVGPGLPELRLLAGQVPLIFWDQGDSRPLGSLSIECGGAQVAAPILKLSAPLEGGGVRMILAFTTPDGLARDIIVKQRDGTVVCAVDATPPELEHSGSTLLEPATVLSGLSDTGRVRVVRFLLQTCRTALGLSSDKFYIDNVQRLVEEISVRPRALEPLCLLDRKFILAAGSLPSPVGGNPVAVMIGGKAVHETPLAPMIECADASKTNRQVILLPLHRAAISESARVVFLGSAGVAIRSIKAAGHPLQPAVSWMATRKSVARPTRDYVLQCLTKLGQTEPGAREAVREILLLGQTAGGNSSAGAKGLVDIDCAVAVSDRLFISGFLADPHNLVQSLKIAVGNWTAKLDRSALHTFCTRRIDKKRGVAETVTGFVALAGGGSPVPQFGTAKFSAILSSRASVDIAQAPLLLTGVEARDAILKAVPTAGVTDTILAETLLPAVDLAQDAINGLISGPPEPVEIGPRSGPGAVSLIMPFDGDPGRIKTWSAALGGGLLFDGRVDLVVVADTDEDLDAAERALDALYRHYGIGSRLVAAAAGMGARASYNAGAHAATGDRLLFLDEGCFPAANNSLARLVAAMGDSQTKRVVTGTILDPAGGIRRSGFAPPQGEALETPYEGFPASHLGSLAAQPVFACSASFLAVARSHFETIGGFSSAFLTRDWTDVDFCLRARAHGFELCPEYQARAIDYGGAPTQGDALQGLSSRLDARRLTRDRQAELTGWCGESGGAAGSRSGDIQPSTSASVGNPRWAA